MFKVKVPATCANMGPGFDAFGIALTLYNEFVFGTKKEVEALSDYEILRETSLCHIALKTFCKDQKKEMPEIFIGIKSSVPRARGLGSSATLTVAAIRFADWYFQTHLSQEEYIRIATICEGHPDNAAPAVLGGFTVSVTAEDGSIHYFRTEIGEDLKVVAQVPEFELRTSDSRRVLPKSVDLHDAVFNLGRCGMMVGALTTGNFDLLKVAMEDKLHQPYRKPLVKGLEESLTAAKKAGAYGVCLSGSGPTALALCNKETEKQAGEAMTEAWKKAGVNSHSYLLSVTREGYIDICAENK